MFEIGKEYRFTTIESAAGEWTDQEAIWKVAAIDGFLLKLTSEHAPNDLILNTASVHFKHAAPYKPGRS